MNFPRGLLAVLVLISCTATAGPMKTTPKPSFSQASRDAYFARTEPLVGELVAAPKLGKSVKRSKQKPAKRTSRQRNTTQRNSSNSTNSGGAAQMKRENCTMMKQAYKMSVKGGGILAIDSSGKEFILKGPRAEAAIAKAKQDVAHWCN